MDDSELPPPLFATSDPLDVPGTAASVDALRHVLSRHRRHQLMLGAVGLVVALIAGFAVGRQGSGEGTQVAAARPAAAGAPSAVAKPQPDTRALAAGVGSVNGAISSSTAPATQLLVRDASDGVRVRLYQQTFTQPKATCSPSSGKTCPQVPVPTCSPSSFLHAEVSDAQVAGTAGGVLWDAPPTGGLTTEAVQVVGAGEPQPILVVLAHAGSNVSHVTLSSSYGTDSAAPSPQGWVALALQLPSNYQPSSSTDPQGAPSGTLTAVSTSGATVSSTALSDVNGKGAPPACITSVCEAGSASVAGPATGPSTVTSCSSCGTAAGGKAPAGPTPAPGAPTPAPAPGGTVGCVAGSSGSGSSGGGVSRGTSSGTVTSSGGASTGAATSGP